jgi:SNF family Na+-dependent transporter
MWLLPTLRWLPLMAHCWLLTIKKQLLLRVKPFSICLTPIFFIAHLPVILIQVQDPVTGCHFIMPFTALSPYLACIPAAATTLMCFLLLLLLLLASVTILMSILSCQFSSHAHAHTHNRRSLHLPCQILTVQWGHSLGLNYGGVR